jgi:hypothetical protein
MLDVVPPDDAHVNSTAISLDGRYFATVFNQRILKVWERVPDPSHSEPS